MISVNDLSMRFGNKILFDKAQLQLNSGQHYGLVGANGAGKSTLIKMFIGEITPDAGQVNIPTTATIGFLRQEHHMYDSLAVTDIVMMGDALLWQAFEQKELLLQKKDACTEEECLLLENIEKIIETKGGYAAASFAAQLLEGLGISNKYQKEPLKNFSGGYKLRVLLAQLLFGKPDILILDEPTNHLDLYSIQWLQNYLRSFTGTAVVSSHDRSFLNTFCQHIIDVDHQTLRCWPGNYDDFEKRKKEEAERIHALLEVQGKKRDEMQNFINRFKAKASKARQANSRERFVEKLEDEMSMLQLASTSRQFPQIIFKQVRASAATVLKVEDIVKTYADKKVLHGVSFAIGRGEKVALVGANGIGKSTLLEIITSSKSADAGSFSWGFATFWSYFPQDHSREVYGDISLLDWLRHADLDANEQQLRTILGMQLFTGDDVKKKVDTLSGGEKARLILAKMMLIKNNVLIFDEPTNHLDMEAIEQLIKSLSEYPGTVLFVSHNGYFLDRLADRVVELSEKGVKEYFCGYKEYLAKKELISEEKGKTVLSPKEEQKQQYEEQKMRQRRKEQLLRKIAQEEKECSRWDEQLEKISLTMANCGYETEEARRKQIKYLEEKKKCSALLEQAMKNWEMLYEELSQLEQK